MITSRAPLRAVTLLAAASLCLAAPTAAQAYDTFSPTAAPMLGVHLFSAIVALPGGKAFVLGGTDFASENPLKAEIYNSTTNTFSLSAGKSAKAGVCDSASAILLKTGDVLITGGTDDRGSGSKYSELFHPTTGLFSATSGTPNYERANHDTTSVLLADGTVLLAGGNGVTGATPHTAEIYNPTTKTFSPTTGTASSPHFHGTATLLANGQVLLVGGFDAEWNRVTAAELYNPTTKTFSNTGSLPVGLASQTATRLPNGNILITGGYTPSAASAAAYVYNVAGKTFTKTTGDMTYARADASAALLANGKVLIMGGGDGSDPAVPRVTTETYNPTTGTFSAAASMGSSRMYARAVLLTNGKILITGGLGSDEPLLHPLAADALSSAELFSPTPTISKPSKPVVKWATNKRKRVVTATVSLVKGTTYKLTAKLGRKTKTGKCKTKGNKVTCTLAPGKGKWTFSITPHNAGGSGKVNGKAIKL